MSDKPLTESEIKAIFLQELRSNGRISPSTIIANEFPIRGSSVRADLAFVDDQFIGVEIKSDRDSLRRLENQLATYRRVFDHVILVAAERHLKGLREQHASEVDEIWCLSTDNSLRQISLAKPRDGGANQFAALLTKRELEKAMRLAGSKELQHAEARQAFESAFSQRFSDTSAAFWEAVGDGPISTPSFALLSRFREARAAHARSLAEREKQWRAWEEFFRSEPRD